MLRLSISAEKTQQFTVSLDGVSTTIKLHQRTSGLFIDMYVGDKQILSGVRCMNATKIIRYKYLHALSGIAGELFFADSLGINDPEYSELGTRYKLYYLTADEVKGAVS